MRVGQRIRYHHSMLDRTFFAVVRKVTKRGVAFDIMNAEEHGVEPHRFLTHAQAAVRLENGWR